jgi:hypothetical protein
LSARRSPSWPRSWRPRGIRALIALQVVAVASVVTLGAVGMLFPAVVPPVPAPGSPVAIAGLAAGSFFYAVLLLRALKTYRLTQRAGDMTVVVGMPGFLQRCRRPC